MTETSNDKKDRILLVDDEPDIIYLVKVGLERSGFEVDSTFWAVKCQKWGIK